MLQEKCIAAKKPIAFVDLEMAFNREYLGKSLVGGVGCKCHPGHVHICQKQYVINGQYSQEFGVRVGVHQGSVLSSHLFIFVLEALSGEFQTEVAWELLKANDFAVITNSLEECLAKLTTQKNGMKGRGLRVNMWKRGSTVAQW